MSLKLDYVYTGAAEFFFIPEVSLFSINYRINQLLSFEAGRIIYSDILSFSASGLFDGVRFYINLPFGKINAGLYYTGLQYKETAMIRMTEDDETNFGSQWKINGSGGRYLASQRIFAAAQYSMPFGTAHDLSAEALAQFDLNAGSNSLHSQYISAHIGAVFEFIEQGGSLNLAFGALAAFKTALPSFNHWLGATVKITTKMFNPVTLLSQSRIFSEANLKGLALISADYNLAIGDFLFIDASLSYYISTSESSAASCFYGGELRTSLIWQPFEDLRATFGAGIFLPAVGNHFPRGTPASWKIKAGVIIAI